jgi:hypothetical protein
MTWRSERALVLAAKVRRTVRLLPHQNDVEVGRVDVPAGPFFGRPPGANQLGDHSTTGGGGDTEVLVLEEVAEAIPSPAGVGRSHVREQGCAHFCRYHLNNAAVGG